MNENRGAYAANLPAAYDARRFEPAGGVELDPLPTMDFRLRTTLRCLEWCWATQQDQQEQQEPPRVVLEVAAGLGNLGQCAQALGADWGYHATEQSDKQCAYIREHVAGASVARWRCDDGHPTLLDTLEAAADPFLRAYPVVLLAHGPEHHADAYRILDECWSLVRPGGFLLVVAARNDPHRAHYRKYDWDDLLALGAHYAGFGNPLVVWELDAWCDLYVAIPKRDEEGDDA